MNKKKRRYKSVGDGEWVQPVMKGYRMSCCDCGLVHEINFKIVHNGKKVRLQAFRNQRSTSALRRHRKFKFTHNQFTNNE